MTHCGQNSVGQNSLAACWEIHHAYERACNVNQFPVRVTMHLQVLHCSFLQFAELVKRSSSMFLLQWQRLHATHSCRANLLRREALVPVCLDQLLWESVVQSLQHVRAHTRACATCNAVAQHKALQTVTISSFTICSNNDSAPSACFAASTIQ